MGYFSRYDVELQEHKEPSILPEIEAMTMRLDYLWERLEDLLRWSENPEYHDRYFYRDHVTEPYELPNTVLGGLDAIAEVMQRLEVHKGQVRMYEAWLETVRKTGATPEGQMVLPRHVFPMHQLQMQAA